MSRGRRRSAPAALLTLMSATAFTCAGAASDTGPMVDASALLPLPASHECPTDRYLTLGGGAARRHGGFFGSFRVWSAGAPCGVRGSRCRVQGMVCKVQSVGLHVGS